METKTSTGDLMEDSKRWEEKHHQIKGREALSNWVKYAPKCLGTPPPPPPNEWIRMAL